MARSSGFVMNRNLRNFLRILDVTPSTYVNAGITEAQAIFEFRAITGKYKTLESIQSDLEEADKLSSPGAEAEPETD